jgi:hypothetical protein
MLAKISVVPKIEGDKEAQVLLTAHMCLSLHGLCWIHSCVPHDEEGRSQPSMQVASPSHEDNSGNDCNQWGCLGNGRSREANPQEVPNPRQVHGAIFTMVELMNTGFRN